MGILDGIRIVDLTHLAAGPYGTMLLADMGAEVIKVESPEGDMTRYHLGPPYQNGQGSFYLAVNRNKKAIVLDLQKPEGLDAFKRLVVTSDVVVHNFRPGIVEKLGIDYEACKALKPDLIYYGISGFGEQGPDRLRAGMDHIFQGVAGAMALNGFEDTPPVRSATPIADMSAGIFCALGIALALLHRERSGEGQKVEYALLDGTVSFQSLLLSYYFVSGKELPKIGNASYVTLTNTYRTRDGWVNVSVPTEKFWRKLCEILGAEDLLEDPRLQTQPDRIALKGEIHDRVAGFFPARTTAEWIEALSAAGIPCGPVNTYDEVVRDPQVLFNEMIVARDHPQLGPVWMTGVPWKFGRTPGEVRTAPPVQGEHTREVLAELGYAEEEIAEFERRDVIRPRPPAFMKRFVTGGEASG